MSLYLASVVVLYILMKPINYVINSSIVVYIEAAVSDSKRFQLTVADSIVLSSQALASESIIILKGSAPEPTNDFSF